MTHRHVLALALTALAFAPASAKAAADPLRDSQWNLDAVNADAAHRISMGTGALVAVLDSGVQSSHPDLDGSVVGGRDFIDGDAAPDDKHGHGTNVAGIIVAHKGNGIGIAGLAPNAKVLAIRILDERNSGSTVQQAAGIDAAVAAGAHVINLSLNPGPSLVGQLLPADPLVRAIERAASAGVVVVAAAGNQALPLCSQPLLATKILCVGAVNRARVRSSYSNYAVRVDLVAPGGEARAGEAISSAQLGGGYSAMYGTSQATPHVAAAAALLVSLGLRGRAVIDRLESTATNLGSSLQLGRGLLNMAAAVEGLGPPLAAAPAPAAGVLTARVSKRVRFRTLRRSGLSVTCTSPRSGSCRVRVTSQGRLLARGSREATAGVPTTVRARLTANGRRTLSRARRVTARITVSAPGSASLRLRSTLVR